MRLVRIALANVNTTVGATRSNGERLVAAAIEAARKEATIALFPEQALGGYAPEDLVQWESFVSAQWTQLETFAANTKALPTVFALGLAVLSGAHVYNAAAIVHAGRILGLVPKEKLPMYNVFYEARTFARGLPGLLKDVSGVPFGDLVFDFDFGTVAVDVCEDVWSPEGPMRRRAHAGAELVCNLSASPFRLYVDETRREMLATRSSDNQATVAYVNLVGANDGLIFDGGGFVFQNGRSVHDAPRFQEQVTVVTVDLDRTRRLRRENTTWRAEQEASGVGPVVHHVRSDVPTKRDNLVYPTPSNKSFFLPSEAPAVSKRTAFCEALLDALALGVGDYFEKTKAFRTIGVALSGGRDSLLCLLIARRYIDRRYPEAERDGKAREILRAFYMPSRYSSEETRAAAEEAAANVSAPFVVLPIDDAFEQELLEAAKMLQPGETVSAAARQNVQARIRAERMWTWANSSSGLFLQTSNMSEKAVGYTTIGGDMEGALSVIANVPKTVVNYLLDYLAEAEATTTRRGIALTLKKPASAELADDQEDEKDLMPFPILDACFALYAGEKMAPAEVYDVLSVMYPEYESATLKAWVTRFARLFSTSIYKWVQTPLSLHVGNLDLDRERALQLPVVQSPEWST